MTIQKAIQDVAVSLKELEKEIIMTEQLRQELEDRLEKAEATGDQERINEARRAIDHHTLECQAHTADRVKRIEKDVISIKSTVEKISSAQENAEKKHKMVASDYYATKDELKQFKARAEGAKVGMKGLMEVLKWVIAVGGGAAVLKLINSSPF